MGSYDYGQFCMPQFCPWRSGKKVEPMFFGPDEPIAPLLGIVMGFQHSLAMLGGIISAGLVYSSKSPDPEDRQRVVSYGLMVSSIGTVIQVAQIRIPGTRYVIGSGLLSVVGTTFSFVPIVQEVLESQYRVVRAEGREPTGEDFRAGIGSLLGVFMVGCLIQATMSFIPARMLRRIFPKWLTGMVVFLIGASLVDVGLSNWGGGAYCASRPQVGCVDVGNSSLPFASPVYLGLGLMSLCTLVVLDVFGSPFMKSCQIMIALMFGYFVAALSTDSTGASFVSADKIDAAPGFTFLWTTPYPFGFYAPALMPVLIGYAVAGLETLGDLTASGEASGLDPEGEQQERAIQGGLLGDAVSSCIAGLCMSLPTTTYSENNGVLSLTRVTSRRAGLWCAVFLFLFGMFGKVGAFFVSIPVPVLGGVTTFLFANIAVSGIKIMSSDTITRRVRFILSVSLGLGIGVIVRPGLAANLWDCAAEQGAWQGICSGVTLTLKTSYAIGAFSAMLLHLVLPSEAGGAPDDLDARQCSCSHAV